MKNPAERAATGRVRSPAQVTSSSTYTKGANSSPASGAVYDSCRDRTAAWADGEVSRVPAEELAPGGRGDLDDEVLVGDADALSGQVENHGAGDQLGQ